MSHQYWGNILENIPFVIPTEVDELAQLIYTYSYDWSVVLDFFDKIARAKGIVLDTKAISQEIRRLIGEVNE